MPHSAYFFSTVALTAAVVLHLHDSKAGGEQTQPRATGTHAYTLDFHRPQPTIQTIGNVQFRSTQQTQRWSF